MPVNHADWVDRLEFRALDYFPRMAAVALHVDIAADFLAPSTNVAGGFQIPGDMAQRQVSTRCGHESPARSPIRCSGAIALNPLLAGNLVADSTWIKLISLGRSAKAAAFVSV